MADTTETGLEIAVIGMAGRFPGAPDIERFWENLKNGVESIAFYSEAELQDAGVEPDLLNNPNYVRCGGGLLEDNEYFDAAFFGYSPMEADMMDPQMRIFHECAWHALEDAGYNPAAYDGLIGLYAGASFSLTWEALSLFSGRLDDLGLLAGSLLIDRDYLCTRVSYRLDLKGPAVVVKTACSTSLVAIHLSCRAILTGECDLALAGGVTVTQLTKSGYLYREGTIASPEGHCRAFDERARGTIFSNGVGLVVLKRLEDAVEDGDHIYAVIKGSAINNDGLRKAGYTAPSVEGQAEVIRMALQAAGVAAEDIGYVETHGTGTELGDPVEIEGLKLAFDTDKRNFCPIGSVKTNIGHLDSAAGIAGFIKTVLVLQHKQIPPSLNFETPNPRIDFAGSPFYVDTKLSEWRISGAASNQETQRRLAAVSSFGIGGTNAHVILEEWPEPASAKVFSGVQGAVFSKNAPWLFLLSARTPQILEQMAQNLAGYLENNPGVDPADVAYTLQVGRKAFEYKKYFVCTEAREAIDFFKSPGNKEANTFFSKEGVTRPVVFMFPGQGAQYVNMALGLYRSEAVFRRELERCFEILQQEIGVDLKEILYPQTHTVGDLAPGGKGAFFEKTAPLTPEKTSVEELECSDLQIIDQTRITQPLVFALEYSMAKLLLSWGIKPYAMIGHSIGEYTAACLSGIFTLEEALKITALRGKLMQSMPPGAMLSVSLPEEQLKPIMIPGVSLAAVNSTANCVVSGTFAAIEKFTTRLNELGHKCRPLHTSHAFHSEMMDPILGEFAESLKKIRFGEAAIPFISDVTGSWITNEEAAKPGYWAGHLRQPVNFRDGLSRLLQEKEVLFIEVGPGNVLSTFLRQHKDKRDDHFAVNLVRHPHENIPDESYLANKSGQCWLYGVTIDWNAFHAGNKRKRLALPQYPFERRAFTFDASPILKETKPAAWRRSAAARQSGDDLKEAAQPPAKEKSPLHARPHSTKPYAPPRSPMEIKIAGIWQNFLGFRDPGIDDDFFELGGDSLNAGTIIARLHRELGVNIPLTEIFQHPTIRELAAYSEQAAQTGFSEIPAVEKREYYPISSAQKRLFILHRFEVNSTAYNMPYILSLEEMPDRGKLEEVFRALTARHESLRTHFEFINEEAVQVIRSRTEIDISINVVSRDTIRETLDPGERIELLVQNFIRPFDLAQAPLMRVGLIPGGAGIPHILMIDMHHIITDGSSQELLIRDFLLIYSGRELPVLRLQYKEYSQWQQSPRTQQVLKKQEEYWLKEFVEEVPVLDMPTDFPRPPVQSYEGSFLRFELQGEETKRLKEIAHSAGATLFMALSALYGIFLAKLSNQEDITLGTAVAGRRYAGLDKIVGMFVNTLALRNYPKPGKSFSRFLEETREKTIKAFENEDYKFEDLLDKLVVKRDMSRNPLFDAMFVLQNFLEAPRSEEAEAPAREDLKIAPYRYEQRTAKFDLTLMAAERDEKLFFALEYCTRLFKPGTIERFIKYYKNIVSRVIGDPAVKIGAIQVLSEEEKRQILVDFNDTQSGFPRDKTIHGLFEDQVGKVGDNIAVVYAGSHLTYGALNRRAARLAGYLKKRGVTNDIIVGIMLERSIEMIVGVFGVLKAGGAYLPLDLTYPAERTRYMIADSGAELALSYPGNEQKTGETCALLDPYDSALYDIENELPAVNAGSPQDTAYVIYTSGSTGKPKGVAIEHKGICSLNSYHRDKFNIRKTDKFIQFASISFDASVWEMYMALLNGAALYPLDEEIVRSSDEFENFLTRSNITAATLPPDYAAYLNPTRSTCLRLLITGGSSPTLELVNRWRSRSTYINAYGPTETTICATCDIVEQSGELQRVSIGKPVNNTCIYITDSQMNILPIGVAGELFISGIGVARGYLNRPELTAEKFVISHSKSSPNNRCPMTDDRLYRTGDLARWLPGGNIEYLGRIDQQVKIRGFRIELGEIENVLTAHEKIKTAVVTALAAGRQTPAKDTAEKEKHLCAYIVTETKLDISELRDYLLKKLPAYMTPSYFKQVERIPLTPAGKIDFKSLDSLSVALASTVPYAAPGSELEKTIGAVWSDVLQLDKVGIDDNFFDLGGNSLDIIKVHNRLKEVSSKSLPVVSMFKYPTIRSLAAYFSETGEAGAHTKIDRSEALERAGRDRNVRREMRQKTRKGERK